MQRTRTGTRICLWTTLAGQFARRRLPAVLSPHAAKHVMTRTWMQIVAEATHTVPDTIWSLSLERDNGHRFAFECGVQASVRDGANVREMHLVGVQTNLPAAQQSDASDVERKFIFDMEFLDAAENAVIGARRLDRLLTPPRSNGQCGSHYLLQ
jgi:hypothetical protein